MDHVVHINDGGEEARPIVLRLLPGEETIFNLKVVNHGEPSNISLEASDPIFKAVRLKKPDHYVVMEETIPVMTRMPANVDRLEGEILLTSSAGTSRVPISLLREAEDPGDDLEEPGVRRDEDPWDDLRRDDLNGDRDLDAGEVESEDEDEEEDGWKEESSSADDDQGDGEKEPEIEPDVEETEARRIQFSRHRDLQSYKAASRPRKMEGPIEAPIEERTEDGIEERIEERIPVEERRAARDYEGARQDRQDYGKDSSYVGRGYQGDAEVAPEAEAETESYDVRRGGISDIFGENGALQVIPLGILLALIFMLVMTFITESIPEFPGALASSILIVTLIIYGAAILLKA